VVWTIDLVDDSNRNGSMEVVVGAAAPESFFPCTVAFSAETSICDITVAQCLNVPTQAPVKFGQKKLLTVTKFDIVH
jgi:coatomer subunit delta